MKKNPKFLFPNLCICTRFHPRHKVLLQAMKLLRERALYFLSEDIIYRQWVWKKEFYFFYKVYIFIQFDRFIKIFGLTSASVDKRRELLDSVSNQEDLMIKVM